MSSLRPLAIIIINGGIMKKTILIATENKGKAEEIKEIFKDTNFELRFLYEFRDRLFGFKIQENAKTFEGNSLIKAIIVGDTLDMLTLADDAGLCVDHLGGHPGVYSARYSEEATDHANYRKLLKEMEGVPFEMRNCHYNCTVAIYDPKSKFVETASGEWHGRLATEPRGDKSFGYAPIFLSADHDYQMTNAELDPQQTTGINHRGKAFRKAIEILSDYLN